MASKNFCNQKVKIKKEMPDSVISISFNKANPFKLCHIKYNIARIASRSVPPETLPLAKDLCRLFQSEQKHGQKLTSTLASRCFPPVFSLPSVLHTFVFLWVFQDVKKNIYNSLKKLFSASTTHANKDFIKLRKMDTT